MINDVFCEMVEETVRRNNRTDALLPVIVEAVARSLLPLRLMSRDRDRLDPRMDQSTEAEQGNGSSLFPMLLRWNESAGMFYPRSNLGLLVDREGIAEFPGWIAVTAGNSVE